MMYFRIFVIVNIDIYQLELENNPPEFCYKLIRISKYTNVNRLEIIFFLLFIALIVLLVILMIV